MNILSRPTLRITPAESVAAASTVVTGLSFWMSFTSLSDLARRNGIAETQAPAFPLIVDGLTIVSTIAAYAAENKTARRYAWTLLILGTAVSVAGNAAHALSNGGGPIAIAISVIPPLVQLASIHLTMTLLNEERRKDVVAPGDADGPLVISSSAEVEGSAAGELADVA